MSMSPNSDSTSDSTSNSTDPETSKPGEKPGELKLVSPPQFEELENPGPASGPSKASAGASAGPGQSGLKPEPSSGATAERGHDSGASERRRPSIWLFLLVFVAFGIALGWQFRLAGQLEQQIVGLEQELREAQVLLGAHKSRLAEIRGGVHDLVTQLDGLRALVDADPSEVAQVVASPVDAPGASIPAPSPAE